MDKRETLNDKHFFSWETPPEPAMGQSSKTRAHAATRECRCGTVLDPQVGLLLKPS